MTSSETVTEGATAEVTDTSALGGAGEVAQVADTSALGDAGEAAAITPEAQAALDAQAATDAAEAARAAVPESYELTAPEGLTIDPKDIEAATPVFKEIGLSNEQANKLMPVAAAFAQRIVDAGNAQILAQVQSDRKAWLDEAKADKEIGGANWDKSLALGASALDNLGFAKGSDFRNLLDESGLGNHPAMIRAWAKVGAAIGDDSSFVRGAGNVSVKQDPSQVLYPNDQPKQGA